MSVHDSVEKLIPGIDITKLVTLQNALADLSVRENLEITVNTYGRSQRVNFVEDIAPFIGGTYGVNPFQIMPKMKGKVFLDIGAGVGSAGHHLAKLIGCTGYVAVEPVWFWALDYQIPDSTQEFPNAIVPADALTFLKALPDNSVSIFMSGMDVITWPNYVLACKSEIFRVLDPQGGFYSFRDARTFACINGLKTVQSPHFSDLYELSK